MKNGLVWPLLTGQHCAQAQELPYAEQAEASPQHRVEHGRDESPVICPGDELGAGGTVGVAAQMVHPPAARTLRDQSD